MVSDWPVYAQEHSYPAEVESMQRIMQAVRAVRNTRAQMKVPPSKKAKLFIATEYKQTFQSAGIILQRLASASEVEVGSGFDTEGCVGIVTADAQILIPLGDLVDARAERLRLAKQLEEAEKSFAAIEAKLSNEAFVSKAPVQVVEAQRAAGIKLADKIEMLKESLSKLA